MGIVERRASDDGLLKLTICRENDGDAAVGFEGFAWHTHVDMIAACSDLGEADAIRRFIDVVLGDRSVIAVCRVGGEVRDAWVSDDPASDLRFRSEDETIEFRCWSGRRAGE
jgi:hypothetical protein